MAQGSQPRRIVLGSHDSLHDGHAALPGDVGKHMMNLQIHLGERLVHVLHMQGGIFHQAGAVPAQGADGTDLALRTE